MVEGGRRYMPFHISLWKRSVHVHLISVRNYEMEIEWPFAKYINEYCVVTKGHDHRWFWKKKITIVFKAARCSTMTTFSFYTIYVKVPAYIFKFFISVHKSRNTILRCFYLQENAKNTFARFYYIFSTLSPPW